MCDHVVCVWIIKHLCFFLITLLPPRATRTSSPFPYTTLFRSHHLRPRLRQGRHHARNQEGRRQKEGRPQGREKGRQAEKAGSQEEALTSRQSVTAGIDFPANYVSLFQIGRASCRERVCQYV